MSIEKINKILNFDYFNNHSCKHKFLSIVENQTIEKKKVYKYKFVLMYNEYNLYFDYFTKEYPLILSSLNLTRTRIFLTLIGRWIDRSSQ